jgi:RNA polymerase sigma-70 factor (ECF subfamily)
LEVDVALVKSAAAGDDSALAALLQAVWPDAYRIAWSVLRERSAAEDAAQDACARLLGSIGKLRQPERFRLWFFRIVVNQAKQRLRHRARDLAWEEPCAPSEASSIEDSIDVRRAIASLEPNLRITVMLHYYYGLNSVEIARVAGTSPVTVRWRLVVARRALRPQLAELPPPKPHPLLAGDFSDERRIVG